MRPHKEYTFDHERHIHRISGQTVPGITTIINPLYDFGAVPKHLMEAARVWGSAVHKGVELYCSDNLGDVDDALKHPLSEFERWLHDERLDHRDFMVEVPMGDPQLMVACIPDILLDGRLVVEIKSRLPNMLTDSIQTEFQERCWIKNGGSKGNYEHRVLYLPVEGSYKYVKVNHHQAWPRCRKLIDYYYDTKMIESWRTHK